MNNQPHEVFDTNYDYLYAAEQRRTGEKGIVQKLGERAIKWFRGMNKKREAEKAEREQNGSLDTFYQAAEVRERQETLQPRQVDAAPGVYRSNFSGEQPVPEFGAEETDDIMERAIARARKNLGALPVATLHDQGHAARETTPGQDDELLKRLQRAYARPAQEPDRDGHVYPDDVDNDLVATKGK